MQKTYAYNLVFVHVLIALVEVTNFQYDHSKDSRVASFLIIFGRKLSDINFHISIQFCDFGFYFCFSSDEKFSPASRIEVKESSETICFVS